ncbi:MAG: four helix bundle protein [bacterium]
MKEALNSKQELKMSNVQIPMTNKIPMSNDQIRYNLEERTALFGEAIIDFAKSLPKDVVTIPLISQVVRAGTSIGANYMEADAASTKKDFRHRLGICRKETKETKHWLRMIARAVPEKKDEARKLWQETQELVRIFSSILK